MDRRIGAQFYTLREHTRTIEDFEVTCRKIHEIGYQIVQISGTPLAAEDMKPILDRYGLKVVTTHRNFEIFQDNLDEIISYNRTLGCELCGLGGMSDCFRASDEMTGEFIRQANPIAAELRKAGLYFGYHNHAFEFMKFGGRYVMDRLINETDPENFKFIVDTYWLQIGGQNPAAFIRKMGDRAMAVHFKDLRILNAKSVPTMAEVGEGNLDWDDIIRACEEAGVRWALVEQAICYRDPFESMKMSYDFLTAKGFE